MIKNYFKLYDTLTKEFYLSEDKAKELIIAIYESGEEKMMGKNLGMAATAYEQYKKTPHSRYEWFINDLPIFIYQFIMVSLVTIALALIILL
jgi:hypothetical protein